MRCALALVALMLMPVLAGAESVDDDANLQVVLVTGVQRGPALWKVSSEGHVLWLLGEISPYPRKVTWRSKEFERLLSRSQELLIDLSGYWTMDEDEADSLIRAGKLPKGKSLQDVISPDLHARLEATAARFGNPRLEELQPFAATNRLASSAMRTLEMEGFSVRFEAARRAAWRKKKVTYYRVPEIPAAQRLANWQHPANEVCLKRLVDVIEDGGRGVLLLANAWSVGDIEELRELAPKYSFSRDGFRSAECAAAMHGGAKLADEYKAKRTEGWIAEAERALKKNRSTVAIVLMSELFEPDGYLAALRAKGYSIVEPK